MRPRSKCVGRRLAVFAFALGMWASAAPAQAAEIKVLSAGAMKNVVTELAEAFRQETGRSTFVQGETCRRRAGLPRVEEGTQGRLSLRSS
jgi:hypothetical protein